MSKGMAVVTGGNKGIGRAVAEHLLSDGFEVLITGRDEVAIERVCSDLADLGHIEGAAFDVTDEDAVTEHLGGLAVDVLVNNAGMATSAPLHRTDLEMWNQVMAVNATGPFLCTRAVIVGMRERDRGRIINLASVASHVGAPYIAAYVASKHAVLGLTRAVAAEVAGTGITCNAVCPAYVDTPMTDRSAATITERTGRSDDEARGFLAGSAPLGRLITPEEVAATVAYLASDAAAPVNGQSIILDGGGVQQ